MTGVDGSGVGALGAEDQPNPARMYDYILGGAANFAADRAMVQQIERAHPHFRQQTRAGRAFLRRVVRYLAAERGIRQFLDLGSGVPTVGHVHEVAQAVSPDARVVYVDNEPVAAAYSRQLLAGVPGTVALQEDLRNSGRVRNHPELRRLLDLDQPVAILMMLVLPFIRDDDEVRQLIAAYTEHTVPGSYLAISHACTERETARDIAERYDDTSQPWRPRSRAAVEAMFAGYDLVEPGVVYVPDWRPDVPDDPDAVHPVILGGLGRKR